MRLDLFPLQTVLFPRMRLPLHIFEPRYRAMIGRCLDEDLPFGVVLIKEGAEVGGPATPHRIGTTARIIESSRMDDGRLNILVAGEERFEIETIVLREPHTIGEVTMVDTPTLDPVAVAAKAADVRSEFRRAIGMILELQAGFSDNLDLPRDPERLAYFVAAGLSTDSETGQRLLESDSLDALLDSEHGLVTRQIAEIEKRLDRRWSSRRN